MDKLHTPPSNQAEVTIALETFFSCCGILRTGSMGLSVMGRRLHWASIGHGKKRILISGGHHANEWIGTEVIMRFIDELCSGEVLGTGSQALLSTTTFYFVPLVNPDGVELAQGRMKSGYAYERAKEISERFPQFAFPSDWKANIRGIDLNLQYPANWEEAKHIKSLMGFNAPAPRDFVGLAPLTEPESLALARFTREISPDMVIALHSQGSVIYWKYGDYEPSGSKELGERMSAVSGYALEETPYESGHAGYKDWFIEEFGRPGYTVELGLGKNPLPEQQLESVYNAAAAIFLQAAFWNE